MKHLFIVIFSLFFTLSYGSGDRNWLTQIAGDSQFSSWILEDFSWVPFPSYDDRDAWNNIPEAVRSQYIHNAEQYLSYDWPAVEATTFLDFVRTGSRTVMQDPYFKRQKIFEALVMAELMEGKGRFLDQIINGVWVYGQETWWGWSAHLSMQHAGPGLPDVEDPVIDLGAAQMGSDLAWTYYFFKDEFDKVNPLISKRLEYEIRHKILEPYYNRDDFWWMGLGENAGHHVNNWNPWCNYNVLNCILLVEQDPAKKVAGIKKVMHSTDQFINPYPEDGGCDEGPSYWGVAGGKLYDLLERLYQVSGGHINIFDKPLIYNIGRYIADVYIADPYFYDYGDASAKLKSRPGTIYLYGKMTRDSVLMKFGSFLAKEYGWKGEALTGKIETTLRNLRIMPELEATPPAEPLMSWVWLPQTEIVAARDREGTTRGFYFAAKGGSNGQSHNHNDVGSFILYYNGKPVLVDAGTGTYTAKTFSSHRYEIWRMQSQYHNLPLINGEGQHQGATYKPTDINAKNTTGKGLFSLDIAKAYPESAEVNHWYRKYVLNRGHSFSITDSYNLKTAKDTNALHFIAACGVHTGQPGKIILTGADFKLELSYDPKEFTLKIENIEIKDPRIIQAWPDGLKRIRLIYKNMSVKGQSKLVLRPVNL